MTKLTPEQVAEIRAAAKLRATLTSKALARKYGVGVWHIQKITSGRRWNDGAR